MTCTALQLLLSQPSVDYDCYDDKCLFFFQPLKPPFKPLWIEVSGKLM